MLNWSRVQELKSDLGEDDFQDVITLFLEEVEDKLSGMTPEPQAETAADLHFLKGSAANLGFENFHAKCEQIEQDESTYQLSELVSLFHESKSTLFAGLEP